MPWKECHVMDERLRFVTRPANRSEVPVGQNEGLKHASAVSLDHVQTVERARLVSYVGSLDAAQMRHVCRALAVATGCSD